MQVYLTLYYYVRIPEKWNTWNSLRKVTWNLMFSWEFGNIKQRLCLWTLTFNSDMIIGDLELTSLLYYVQINDYKYFIYLGEEIIPSNNINSCRRCSQFWSSVQPLSVYVWKIRKLLSNNKNKSWLLPFCGTILMLIR